MRLFATTSIKGITLANRFVRSATWEGLANDDGSCTPRLIDLMVELARGDIGLMITGHAYISPKGQAGPRQLGAYSDELLPGLGEMTRAVHSAGGKIVLQLSHAGVHAYSKLTRIEPFGPSQLENEQRSFCREMTQQEIQETTKAFGEAAERAQRAGFDGVQIQAAHGYLLSQFLSPFYNRRKDDYGGTPDRRARIVLEALESVRTCVGNHFPVLLKINSEDFLTGGFCMKDMLQLVAWLEKVGVDAIELSGGTILSGNRIPIRKAQNDGSEKEVYYLEAAKRYKEKVSVPLMLVGGTRSYEVAEELVDKGLADYISLCRPLIREPHLINRWRSGDTRKSFCLSDNHCIRPIFKGKGLYCAVQG